MGYLTNYYLRWNQNEVSEKDICEKLCKINSDFEDADDVDYIINGYDNVRWYEAEDDILQLSKIYPKTSFILEGWGEDNGDIWRYYALNGCGRRVQAKITFEEPSFIRQ